MADIMVVEEGTGTRLSGAWFDHSYRDAGDGFYSVTLNGDLNFVVGKSGYYNKSWSILWSTTVGLQKVQDNVSD